MIFESLHYELIRAIPEMAIFLHECRGKIVFHEGLLLPSPYSKAKHGKFSFLDNLPPLRSIFAFSLVLSEGRTDAHWVCSHFKKGQNEIFDLYKPGIGRMGDHHFHAVRACNLLHLKYHLLLLNDNKIETFNSSKIHKLELWKKTYLVWEIVTLSTHCVDGRTGLKEA